MTVLVFVWLFEELRGRYSSERLSLLADAEAQQAERRRLVVQLTEAATQRAAAETKLRAANKTITSVSWRGRDGRVPCLRREGVVVGYL